MSGTRCLHLHYLEAVKSISICLSLCGHAEGPLGDGWLPGTGVEQEMVLRQRQFVCSNHLSQGRVTAEPGLRVLGDVMWGDEQCVGICASLPLLQYAFTHSLAVLVSPGPLPFELDPSSWGHLAFFCPCVG